jgi:uncharacterized NAD-dependent epimerase/dehydratase family protein
MQLKAIVYSESHFGKLDGKVANGLVRHSEKYDIVGVIDSTRVGLDAGAHLDGVNNDIPIFKDIDDALQKLNFIPEYFIYGIAPLASFLSSEERAVIFYAMKKGMNIVNGMPEFLNDDVEFVKKKKEYGVQILDVRKPPARKDLHLFSGRIFDVKTPIITVLGTDCAIGKRTTSIKLAKALEREGVNVVFITTGQTGLIQGSMYGIAVDVLSSGFNTGEIENEIIRACETDHPDLIIIEGQGALSHPAFISSTAIIRGGCPKAIIVQHPPKRKTRCDYPSIPMPTLESEINLLETVSKVKVIAIALNHEDMTDKEIKKTITEYERKYNRPTTDVLKYGCDKIVKKLFEVFPELSKKRVP